MERHFQRELPSVLLFIFIFICFMLFKLLDWAYYLHLYNNGYIGIPCKGYFHAFTKPDSISAGSAEDYHEKFNNVKNDFIDILQ